MHYFITTSVLPYTALPGDEAYTSPAIPQFASSSPTYGEYPRPPGSSNGQLKAPFPDHPLEGIAMDKAYSVLYALLRGMVQALDLEESDIAGCLQSIHMGNTYALGMIFYDTTPGGAGHVRRLQNVDVLNRSVLNAINIMENCTCGGEEGHASCYACLRNYRNQKLHDYLDRSLAAQYLKRLFE